MPLNLLIIPFPPVGHLKMPMSRFQSVLPTDHMVWVRLPGTGALTGYLLFCKGVECFNSDSMNLNVFSTLWLFIKLIVITFINTYTGSIVKLLCYDITDNLIIYTKVVCRIYYKITDIVTDL